MDKQICTNEREIERDKWIDREPVLANLFRKSDWLLMRLDCSTALRPRPATVNRVVLKTEDITVAGAEFIAGSEYICPEAKQTHKISFCQEILLKWDLVKAQHIVTRWDLNNKNRMLTVALTEQGAYAYLCSCELAACCVEPVCWNTNCAAWYGQIESAILEPCGDMACINGGDGGAQHKPVILWIPAVDVRCCRKVWICKDHQEKDAQVL